MKKTLCKLCVIVFFLVFSGTANANESTRKILLNTLDHLEVIISQNCSFPPDTQDRINEARNQVLLESPAALDNIPQDLENRLKMIEASTDMMAVFSTSAPKDSMKSQDREMSVESKVTDQDGSTNLTYEAGDLTEPLYPEVEWDFMWNPVALPDPGEQTPVEQNGICSQGGYPVQVRFVILNLAIIAEAVKDIAEQFCGQTVGANLSVLCVVTDVAAYVAIGVNENQDLCNDLNTAAEVTASWNGIKTVHGNVRFAYESLDSNLYNHDQEIKTLLTGSLQNLDSDLYNHDEDIKTLLSELLQNQQRVMGDLQTVIQLLNTPQGIRPEWNK